MLRLVSNMRRRAKAKERKGETGGELEWKRRRRGKSEGGLSEDFENRSGRGETERLQPRPPV